MYLSIYPSDIAAKRPCGRTAQTLSLRDPATGPNVSFYLPFGYSCQAALRPHCSNPVATRPRYRPKCILLFTFSVLPISAIVAVLPTPHGHATPPRPHKWERNSSKSMGTMDRSSESPLRSLASGTARTNVATPWYPAVKISRAQMIRTEIMGTLWSWSSRQQTTLIHSAQLRRG